MKHKGAMGNGQGRAVEVALEHAEEAAKDIAEMKAVMEKMNDKQRKLFVALSRQKDSLQATLEAGYNEWFTGITRKLMLKEEYRTGKKDSMDSKDLTLANLYLIDQDSYNRLLSICDNRVAKQTANSTFKDHITSINDFLQLIAPDAYAVIGDIMLDENVKPEIRLKAADSLLDRAGYKEKAGSGGMAASPMQVNVVLTNNNGEVIEVLNGTDPTGTEDS